MDSITSKPFMKYALLICLVLFAAFSAYSRHSGNRFPYHHDEWQHLGISVQAMVEGYNRQYNPFIGKETWHADLEPGFHLYLASLFQMTGHSPILSYQYF